MCHLASHVRTKALFTILFIIVPLTVLFSVWSVGIKSTPAVQVKDCYYTSGGQCAATIGLHGGDQVSGKISYDNGSGIGATIWVTNPSGEVVYNSSVIKDVFVFQFSAVNTGAYVLHIRGPLSLVNNAIAIDYVDSIGIDCY